MTDAAPSTPAIGVVILHHGDPSLTHRAVERVGSGAAFRIVVVDNDPGSGLAAWVPGRLPPADARHLTIIEPGSNTGFAGGCNMGITLLPEVDVVVLLNNDAVVGPEGVVALADAVLRDPGLGAVVPKVVFEGRFHDLELEAAETWRPGRGDERDLAWQPRRVEVGDEEVTGRCQLVEGFWEPGRGGRWAGERSLLRVPARPHATSARIELATPPGQAVELTVNGRQVVRVAPGVGWVDVALEGEPVPVIANVGNARRADGYGIDVGRYEADRGQHDDPRPIEAWCGGAVALRADYLRDVGRFDERLFLYYEDLELSLRGTRRGWRYAYDPTVVVEHRVGAAAGADVTRSERLKERNRLLVLARHGSLRRLATELARFVLVTLAYVRREIVAPPLRRSAPCGWLVKVRALALGGVLVRLPGMLASRVADRRRRRRPGIPPLA